ncbi:MAG: RsmB/NOP family class I SAM-dependent RNA methyltransferase [Euryarchaeota archaeon]|nr:RsmB/NOP family class I SAM-dependent RNA methyltransferase [Euryarchaeota archaeon]
MLEKIATKVVAKYLRKGNMSRCLRDILPATDLTKEQREIVAETVHDVVRWKKLYDKLLDERSIEKLPENYVQLALEGAHKNVHTTSFEYQYSCSEYVANILKDKLDWARHLNEKPPTTLCVNQNKSSKAEVIEALKKEKMPVGLSKLETAVITTSIAKYSSVIKNRYAHVQDESSQLISYITVNLGDKILDFCAGSGGKSLSMASITKNKKTLHAYEINAKKRMTLEQRCREYDAKVLVEEDVPDKMFDVVLVDAPCTGIGAARRNPEAKYVEGSGDFPEIQLKILMDAAQKVVDGGSLIYSLCTFTPEETEDVIKQFSKTSGFKVAKANDFGYPNLLLKSKYGAFANVPNGDIFFVSILRKEK